MRQRKVEERLNPDKPIPYFCYQLAVNLYVFASRFVADRVILDLGCGYGYGSNYLAAKDAKLVVGGDYDRKAIYYCKNQYRQVALDYMTLDAVHLPFRDDYFDVIVCFGVIEHVGNYKRLLTESRRVLKKGGIFICSTPNRESHFRVPKTPYHIHEFSVEEVYDLLKEYFDEVTLGAQIYLDRKDIKTEKWWNFVGAVGSIMLSYIPFGDQVKKLTTRFVMRENYPIKFRENFDDTVDGKYKVLPLTRRTSKIPVHLIAVAKTP